MILQITSITGSETGELINGITTTIENQLRPLVEPRNYGGDIQQFIVFFVSVDSDPIENERYCRANNRSSRYKDLLAGETKRFVGLAVPVDPAVVMSSSQEALSGILRSLLLNALAAPAYAMPKKFDRLGVLADFRTALQQSSWQS